MVLTQEQIERIENGDLVQYLTTAYKAQYIRNTTRKEKELAADILDEATGRKCSRQWSCNKCVFDIFYRLSKHYFETMSNTATEEEIASETEEKPTTTKITTQKKKKTSKRGRKATKK